LDVPVITFRNLLQSAGSNVQNPDIRPIFENPPGQGLKKWTCPEKPRHIAGLRFKCIMYTGALLISGNIHICWWFGIQREWLGVLWWFWQKVLYWSHEWLTTCR